MATTTIGSNPGVNDWVFDASMHQCWVQNYVPGSLGRMIRVDAYCAAASGGGTGGAVAWQNVTSAPLQTTSDGMGAGSGTSGAWHGTTGDIPFGSSDSWQFGFYASRGVWCIYHADGGSTFVKASAISASNGGTNVSAYGFGTGSMSAYGTYFIVQTYVWRSGGWQKTFLIPRRSSAWTTNAQVFVWRSGAWIQACLNNIPFDYEPVPIRYQDGTKGLIVFEGPLYLGPSWAQEFHLHGEKILRPRPYELVTV
jgi:hypothetical protein